MSSPKTILYIKPLANISFIDNDEKILVKHFNIKVSNLNTNGLINNFKSQLSIIFQLIFGFGSYDIIYIWFADYYTFFPALVAKLSSKQCFIVIGGYDSAKVPEINYGAHLSKIRSYFIKKSCEWSTGIFPVTRNAEENLFENIGINLKAKSKVIYNMIDTDFFKLDTSINKTNKVVYLANVDNETGWKRKNIDFIITIAQNMPEVAFDLIGLKGDFHTRVQNLGLKNVSSSGHLSKEKFKHKLAEAKVICLFSIFESFGISVGEGILMGCIPLSMQHLGTAELICNPAYLLHNYDVDEASEKIRKALAADNSISQDFIDLIFTRFSPANREKALLEAM